MVSMYYGDGVFLIPRVSQENFRNFRKFFSIFRTHSWTRDNSDQKGPLERLWSSLPPLPEAGLKALSIKV